MAGFAAASYMRGTDFIQIPTSLLAQVDSSVGGKTAVNIPEGKNLVGAFWPPLLVICDTDVLKTLPEYYLIDGLGEAVKHAMIKSESLFKPLETHDIGGIRDILDGVVCENIKIKRDVVAADEFEAGERMLLNFGHTLGHSIEHSQNYKGISHGRAVAAGMSLITDIFEKLGETVPGTSQRLKKCLGNYRLDCIPDIPPVRELADACLIDKKRRGGTMNLAVCKQAGVSFIKKMSADEFGKMIKNYS